MPIKTSLKYVLLKCSIWYYIWNYFNG